MKVNNQEASLMRCRSEHERRSRRRRRLGGKTVGQWVVGCSGTWLSGVRSVGDDGWTGGQFLKCGRGRSGLTPLSSTKSPWPLVVLRRPKGLFFFFSFFGAVEKSWVCFPQEQDEKQKKTWERQIYLFIYVFFFNTTQNSWRGDLQNNDYQEKNEIQEKWKILQDH